MSNINQPPTRTRRPVRQARHRRWSRADQAPERPTPVLWRARRPRPRSRSGCGGGMRAPSRASDRAVRRWHVRSTAPSLSRDHRTPRTPSNSHTPDVTRRCTEKAERHGQPHRTGRRGRVRHPQQSRRGLKDRSCARGSDVAKVTDQCSRRRTALTRGQSQYADAFAGPFGPWRSDFVARQSSSL